jgi:hypothetical protein
MSRSSSSSSILEEGREANECCLPLRPANHLMFIAVPVGGPGLELNWFGAGTSDSQHCPQPFKLLNCNPVWCAPSVCRCVVSTVAVACIVSLAATVHAMVLRMPSCCLGPVYRQ